MPAGLRWTWAAAIMGLAAGCASMSLRAPEARRDFAEAVIENWSAFARLQASRMMAEYGPPDRVEYTELVWNAKGPWKEVRVWDVSPYYDSNLGPPNLQQTIVYRVNPETRRLLGSFNGQLRVSADGAELSSRASSEEDNFLALNLANDIVAGRATPEQARGMFDRTQQLTLAGKSSPYTQRLLFTPAKP